MFHHSFNARRSSPFYTRRANETRSGDLSYLATICSLNNILMPERQLKEAWERHSTSQGQKWIPARAASPSEILFALTESCDASADFNDCLDS
jgi:hypothetical protein